MYFEVYQTFYECMLSVMFKDFAIYILINVLINVQITKDTSLRSKINLLQQTEQKPIYMYQYTKDRK